MTWFNANFRISSPKARVYAVTATILATSLALSLVTPDFYTFESSRLLGLVAVGVFFLVSEKFAFHIEAQTEASGYSPSDIGLGIALVLFNPIGVVIARGIGATIGQILCRRNDPLKLVFNFAVFTTETVLAFAVCRGLGAALSANLFLTWFGLFTALFVALLSSGLLVAVAIACLEGGLLARLKAELKNAPVFHLPGATIAAALAVAASVSLYLGLAVASVLPVLWATVRAHGLLLHQHQDLVGAHEFSREVADASEVDALLATAADQIASNMRSGLVAIRVWDRTGRRTDGFHGGRSLASELPDDLSRLHRARATDLDLERADNDVTDFASLRVLLSDEQGSLGYVVVADRQGVTSRFFADDLHRLTTMTQQLTVAVRKSQLLAQIRHEATHDTVTALTNRSFFEAWVDEAITDADEPSCTLFIDLDRFKEVNDAFGHHAGDALLREVATRIQLACPIDGLTSRFGGDEFAIFVPHTSIEQAEELAARIALAVEAPLEVEGTNLSVSPSIGIVESPSHGRVATKLLRRADIAMYEAKRSQRKYAVYNDGLEDDDLGRLTLLSDLRTAISNDELQVHFQPQIDMQTGRVIGAEALARWTHPDHGNVRPDIFVALAEDAGLIGPLTNRVLAKSIAAAAQWQRRGWDLNVAVNISARSFLDQNLVTMVKKHLDDGGLLPSRLTLEITESTIMTDPARTHDILMVLTSLGVTISVDDFGTGYSSLRSLGLFPVSELKIDRSFVMGMSTSEHDAIIVRSTIDLAHNLGLRAVAEGVETDELSATLRDLDCDLAQGYGISRPLPLDGFNHWFIDRPGALGTDLDVTSSDLLMLLPGVQETTPA